MEQQIEALRDCTVLITGATGFIGSQLVKSLDRIATVYGFDVRILAQIRDEKKADRIFKSLKRKPIYIVTNMDGFHASKVEETCSNLEQIDFVFHCAAATSSMEMIQRPVEVAEGIVFGTKNVLEIAKAYRTKSMVYLSTMEIYGNIDCDADERITEKEQGIVNLLEARSCYPMGKRMAETLCYSYFAEYGVPVRIARLAQTFGAGVSQEDQRVFAQFARCAVEKRDIVLHTEGKSVGNYCGIGDVISALLFILCSGSAGEAYNVVNESLTMTIHQMAELVMKEIAKGNETIKFEIPRENIHGYAAKTGLRLSSEKLEKLGWRPEETMIKMYTEMINSWEEADL